jgi:ribonucleoside-triphosphate reductase
MFNSLIESGSITHAFIGEQKPDPDAILNLVKKTFENTQSVQITISPEFTVCNDCHKISRGYGRGEVVPVLATDGGEKKPRCPHCGSENVIGMSRVVGYYSIIDNWNPGKKAEFKDRQKGNYGVPSTGRS